jgi:hypothetical protein
MCLPCHQLADRALFAIGSEIGYMGRVKHNPTRQPRMYSQKSLWCQPSAIDWSIT